MPSLVQTPRASSRVRDSAASTARLLDAAGEEFASHGFDGARVARIAAASATNRAIMFQRFGDKAGLYRAVLARVAEDAEEIRRRLVADRPELPATLQEFRAMVADVARANLRFLGSHLVVARILRWERAADWRVFRLVRPVGHGVAVQTIVEWFRHGASQGWLRGTLAADTQLTLTFELAAAMVGVDEEFGVAAITAAFVVDEASQ